MQTRNPTETQKTMHKLTKKKRA